MRASLLSVKRLSRKLALWLVAVLLFSGGAYVAADGGADVTVDINAGTLSPSVTVPGDAISASPSASAEASTAFLNEHANCSTGTPTTWSWSIASVQKKNAQGTYEDATHNLSLGAAATSSPTLSGSLPSTGVYRITLSVTATLPTQGTSCPGNTISGTSSVSYSVTVVNISKLQYRLSDEDDYADVPSPLIVAVGQSVEFKALPDPQDADWPTNKPQWSGSSGVSGTGGTKSVEFSTASTTVIDYKTVTVECGNEVTANVLVYSATLGIRRRGSGDNFSSTATVAAGGKSSDEHKADLELQVTPAIAGIAFNDLVVTSGGQDAGGTLNASAPWDQPAVTGADGRLTGIFTSGNRVETTTLTLTYGADSTLSVSADQKWNELEGSENAWNYDPYYVIGIPSPISYKMTFEGGVPITGHSVSFQTKSITGWEWNNLKPVDEDGDGVTDYYGDYDEDVTYDDTDQKLQTGGVYSDLVTYSMPTSEGTGTDAGIYSSNMTVKDLLNSEGEVDFYTDIVEFHMTDSAAMKLK
jgi:hypothetical protein